MKSKSKSKKRKNGTDEDRTGTKSENNTKSRDGEEIVIKKKEAKNEIAICELKYTDDDFLLFKCGLRLQTAKPNLTAFFFFIFSFCSFFFRLICNLISKLFLETMYLCVCGLVDVWMCVLQL